MALPCAHTESQKNGEPVDGIASAPSAPTERARFLLSGAFAFMAGYADVLSVRLYHVFATMMTGNAFFIGSELVTGTTIPVYRWTEEVTMRAWVFRVVVIAAFCFGLLAFEFVAARVKRFGAATILAPPIGIATIVLNFCFPKRERWQVVAMAVIFGIQNGVSSQGFGGSTTMVTGHLTKLAKALTKIRSRDDAAALSHNNVISIAVVIFIVIGAAFGQWSVQMYQAGKIGTVLAPVGPIMAVLLVINDHIFHRGNVDVIESGMSLGRAMTSSSLAGYGTAVGANGGDAHAHQDHQKLDV